MRLRRRELIRRGAAAGGGALALATLRAVPASAGGGGDREILLELLELERRLERTYASLGRPEDPDTTLFGEHCREHARGLAIALANRGGSPGDRGGSPGARGGPAGEGGGEARGGERPAIEPLAPTLELEATAVAAYHRAHAGFGDLAFLPTLTSIMANHGQHLAVLRRRLGEEPATLAFETGSDQE
jgi:hypothetical protein